MKIFLTISLLILGGCTQTGPWPLLMSNKVEGSPEFQAGWEHGCESGFATYGTAIYKMAYSFKQEYSMMDNRDYDVAWHEAFDFCRHYVYKWNTQPMYMDPL
jgi:hypothetical protein